MTYQALETERKNVSQNSHNGDDILRNLNNAKWNDIDSLGGKCVVEKDNGLRMSLSTNNISTRLVVNDISNSEIDGIHAASSNKTLVLSKPIIKNSEILTQKMPLV